MNLIACYRRMNGADDRCDGSIAGLKMLLYCWDNTFREIISVTLLFNRCSSFNYITYHETIHGVINFLDELASEIFVRLRNPM
jgi:hypothetical protein